MMKEYQIRMYGGIFKYNLGKYYIQFRKSPDHRWRNYKEVEYYDDWKSTKYFTEEQEAIDKVSELIKEEINTMRLKNEAKEYVKEFSVDKIAKVLLEEVQ